MRVVLTKYNTIMSKITQENQHLTSKDIIQANLTESSFADNYNRMPEKTVIAPKAAFVEMIMNVTGCSKMSVFNWIGGRNKPTSESQEKIERALNIPSIVLFPQLQD